MIYKLTNQELIQNAEMLRKMYQFVLDNHYQMTTQKWTIDDYAFGLEANDKQKQIFYLEKKGKIICYLEAEPISVEKYYISMLTTVRGYRNKGLATEFFCEVIEQLQKEKGEVIFVHINKNKPWLIAFCQRLGFHIKDNHVDNDEVQMILEAKKRNF